MNRFGTRLVGAAATPSPPPKAHSNENLDKIDMSLGEEPSWTELEWGEGVGGTTDRCLWGKGRLATVVDRVFLRVDGTKWEPQGTDGGRQLVPKARVEPEDLGVSSTGLCLRGAVRAGGASVPEAWRVEGCVAPDPPRGALPLAGDPVSL